MARNKKDKTSEPLQDLRHLDKEHRHGLPRATRNGCGFDKQSLPQQRSGSRLSPPELKAKGWRLVEGVSAEETTLPTPARLAKQCLSMEPRLAGSGEFQRGLGAFKLHAIAAFGSGFSALSLVFWAAWNDDGHSQ